MQLRLSPPRALVPLLFLGTLALAPTVSAADTTVEIVDFAFTPSATSIEVGDSVTWTNRDSAPHDATGTGWATPLLLEGDSASVTFDAAGTFEYICSVHPDMTGSVTVAAAGGGDDDGDDGDGGDGDDGDDGEAPTITDPPTDTTGIATPGAAGGAGSAAIVVVAASAAAFLAALRIRRPTRN
jgi:plastocyanin